MDGDIGGGGVTAPFPQRGRIRDLGRTTAKTFDAFLKETLAIERAKGVADAIRTIHAHAHVDAHHLQRVLLDEHPRAVSFVDYGSRTDD